VRDACIRESYRTLCDLAAAPGLSVGRGDTVGVDGVLLLCECQREQSARGNSSGGKRLHRVVYWGLIEAIRETISMQ
jgi:hypothetical protein